MIKVLYLLNIFYKICIENGILLNPLKYVCIFFRPKRYALRCPPVNIEPYTFNRPLFSRCNPFNNYYTSPYCSILDRPDEGHKGLQTTQPTSGEAVTVVSSCCANCVEPPRPLQWWPDLPFFGHAGHADPLDGWRCCSQKRVMSRPIQVRQL